MNYFFSISLIFCWIFSTAQDTITVRKKVVISAQSILLVKTTPTKQDSINFKTPKYKQGFFCNFEDQLNRKKVPIDFSLGKSKY
ncbi:MAG: hypothetical protein KA174_08290, partial [Chitinophagales bacterium]|nr:hypothetical protein [Chitinophagales bacterium]